MRTNLLVVALILLGAILIGVAFRCDDPVQRALTAEVKAQGKHYKKSNAYDFYSKVRSYGDWPELMLVGLAGVGLSLALRKRDWVRILTSAMIASTLAGLVINASRLTTGRTRPGAPERIQQGFYGPWHDGKFTIGVRDYNSFPSGHTATAFGFAGVILFARPWLGLGAIFIAGVIAWCSVMIRAHHPSDVVTAAFLSLMVSWFVWRWTEKYWDAATVYLRKKIRSLRSSPPVRD